MSTPDARLARRQARRDASERRRAAQAWARISADVRWGLTLGWLGAGLLSLWVLGLALLSGSTLFEKYGMSVWGILLAYLAAGTLGGALLGVLRPLTRTRPGGALVGALVGICFYGAVAVAADGWAAFDPWFALVAGIPVGGAVGWGTVARYG